MPFFLADFMKQNSGIDLLMDVTNKNKVVESLENNEVDFALVSILPTSLNIDKLDLLQNKLYLVGSSKTKFKQNLEANDFFKDFHDVWFISRNLVFRAPTPNYFCIFAPDLTQPKYEFKPPHLRLY